ncbi:hypothetical protein FSARC_7465 [Fusarium sarcochroum]|uniref:Uncharacterized protein n=1 Tax=Fusarium sarcochroum TaxID=1208366 RepID=A0A8H4X7C6_9HYPO|nr:hypothetical protein FSARC_7465 [Fusarium sarcochroum]
MQNSIHWNQSFNGALENVPCNVKCGFCDQRSRRVSQALTHRKVCNKRKGAMITESEKRTRGDLSRYASHHLDKVLGKPVKRRKTEQIVDFANIEITLPTQQQKVVEADAIVSALSTARSSDLVSATERSFDEVERLPPFHLQAAVLDRYSCDGVPTLGNYSLDEATTSQFSHLQADEPPHKDTHSSQTPTLNGYPPNEGGTAQPFYLQAPALSSYSCDGIPTLGNYSLDEATTSQFSHLQADEPPHKDTHSSQTPTLNGCPPNEGGTAQPFYLQAPALSSCSCDGVPALSNYLFDEAESYDRVGMHPQVPVLQQSSQHNQLLVQQGLTWGGPILDELG